MTNCGCGGAQETMGGGAHDGPQIVAGTSATSQPQPPRNRPPNGIHWAWAVWVMPPRLSAPNKASLLIVKRDMEPFLSKVVGWEMCVLMSVWERIATQVGRWDVVAVSRVTVGTIGSAVVAWGEMYLNLKNRSIPSDFVSSSGEGLPQPEFEAQVTSITWPQSELAQRQFLPLLLKKFRKSSPNSGKFCHSSGLTSGNDPQSQPLCMVPPTHDAGHSTAACENSNNPCAVPANSRTCIARTIRPESLAAFPQIPGKSTCFGEKLGWKMAILGKTELRLRKPRSRVYYHDVTELHQHGWQLTVWQP